MVPMHAGGPGDAEAECCSVTKSCTSCHWKGPMYMNWCMLGIFTLLWIGLLMPIAMMGAEGLSEVDMQYACAVWSWTWAVLPCIYAEAREVASSIKREVSLWIGEISSPWSL